MFITLKRKKDDEMILVNIDQIQFIEPLKGEDGCSVWLMADETPLNVHDTLSDIESKARQAREQRFEDAARAIRKDARPGGIFA